MVGGGDEDSWWELRNRSIETTIGGHQLRLRRQGMASEDVLVVHSRILRDNYWKRLLQWGDG